MKALFGVLALVIALAGVASIVRKQLAATGVAARTGATSQAGATSAEGTGAAAITLDPGTGTARQKSATLQEQARDRTTQALQQGAERNRRAEP
jgi:hypothetical protein